MSMRARDYVQAVAYNCGDGMYRKRDTRYYLNRVNIARIRTVKDTHALIKVNPAVNTTAGKRNYNVVDDLSANDFLAVHHIRVDGYIVYPCPNGWRDMDLKNNIQGNRILGYVYTPGASGVTGLPLGTIYFEPIPSDAFRIDLIYVYAPPVLVLENNTVCDIGDEYAPMVESLATALCFPPGSNHRVGGQQEYMGWVGQYRWDLETAGEPLDIPT